MKMDKFGQCIYTEDEVFDALMKDASLDNAIFAVVDADNNTIIKTNKIAGRALLTTPEDTLNLSIEEFDAKMQEEWHMPTAYKELDICEFILSQCNTQEELQRCAAEIFLYQERDLFDLLRYMKYLVDLMEAHSVIWGVGRGSSVSSYVLFKLKVHKIDSMYYDLDVTEFLR